MHENPGVDLMKIVHLVLYLMMRVVVKVWLQVQRLHLKKKLLSKRLKKKLLLKRLKKKLLLLQQLQLNK